MITDDFISPLREKLKAEGFVFEIKARVKSAYSIYRKMTKKNIPFEEIFDIYAIRVIFENDDDSLEEPKARRIAEILSQDFTVHPDRTRDWLRTPKDNGYRALHLTLQNPVTGIWTEVQIRAEDGRHRRTRIRRTLEIQRRGEQRH